MLMLQRPEITQEELGKNRTQFVIEPLEPGFGLTLGNTMRRALLSSCLLYTSPSPRDPE